MTLLFLDFDGVLNGHEKMPNGYSGVQPTCRDNLNRVLQMSDARIVVHSAWRYLALSGSMNLAGLQNMMLTHGIDCYDRLHGYTESDERTAAHLGRPQADFSSMQAWHSWVKEHGAIIRRQQIENYANEHGCRHFIVLDDIDLGMPQQIVTNGVLGFTWQDSDRALQMLGVLPIPS